MIKKHFILLLLFLIPVLIFPATQPESLTDIEENLTCEEFDKKLDAFIGDASLDNAEKLQALYSVLEHVRELRIDRSINTYYYMGQGERPSSSTLDHNLKYTLFIEEIYKRIDGIKIETALSLKEIFTPISGLTGELNTRLETLTALNGNMKEAVNTAETSYKEMIEIRDDYLDVIDLQRELMRTALRTSGPQMIILTGCGLSGDGNDKSVITAEAGILSNLGLFDLGLKAHAGTNGNFYGVSLLLGINVK